MEKSQNKPQFVYKQVLNHSSIYRSSSPGRKVQYSISDQEAFVGWFVEISLVITLALVIIIIAFCFMAVSVYNGLIALDKQVQRAWANVDIIQKQRFDEIPQLIDVI